jgi:hypothetical protein
MGKDNQTGGQMAASLRILWAMQTKAHSFSAFSKPRRWNLRKRILWFYIPEGAFGLDTALLSQGDALLGE